MVTEPKKMTNRTKLALWLLITPTVLIMGTVILFAIVNLVLNPTMWPKADSEMFTPTPIGIAAINIILYLTGVIGTLTWLPGLITGIVLLATKKKDYAKD